MKRTTAEARKLLVTMGLIVFCMPPLNAKVSQEQADKLGIELTPVGAQPQANANGSIPEWTGESNFTDEQKALTPDDLENTDPAELEAMFSIGQDKPKLLINSSNWQTHKDKLLPGHAELFSRYNSYSIPVYESVRTGFFPREIYEATKANATTAELEGTDAVRNAKLGFPFPIPQRAEEVIWNHKMKFRGTAVRRYNNQAIVQAQGDFVISKLIEDVKFKYANIHDDEGNEDELMFFYMSNLLAPPRNAGQIILVREPIDQSGGSREAWIYNPGLKRVRRLPNAGYDNPSEGTDGEQTNDQIDMFNGALDRYSWKLVGKKELYIPYNSAKINDRRKKYRDIISAHHLNQSLTRYELHRVWVVEATVREGINHLFRKRLFYLDEDSWSIAAVDCFDDRGNYWKFQEGHLITAPFVPTVTAIPEVIYDMQTGRYFLTALQNEDKVNDFKIEFKDSYFTKNSMKKKATR